jgi:sulfonate transport system substrate-binding protein
MITRRHTLAGLASTPLLHHAAVADSVTLRAGDQKGGTQSLMKAAGVLDDVPYQITWNQFAAAAPLLEALNAGAVDLAFAGDAPATFALAAGLQARIVAPIRTTGAGTAILVPNTSPIRTVADLRGRSVATNRGSIGHALVLAIIQAQGWAPGDIKLVNLMPSEAKSALSVGAVDAWCSWGVYVAQARLVDGARVVVDGGHGLMTGLSYLLATDTAIAQRRAALTDFCRRLAVARRWALAHQSAYARVLAAEIGVSEAVAGAVFDTEQPKPIPIDALVIADEQRTADLYFTAGVIRARLDTTHAFDATFNQALTL